MDRNVIIAFILSTVVIVGYYMMFPPPTPEEVQVEQAAITETVKDSAPKKSVITRAETEDLLSQKGNQKREIVKVESPLYSADFDTKNGVVKSFLLKNYKENSEAHFNVKDWVVATVTGKDYTVPEYDTESLVQMIGDPSEKSRPFYFSADQGRGSVYFKASSTNVDVEKKTNSLILTGVTDQNLAVTKTFTFHPDSYLIDLDVQVKNLKEVPTVISPELELGAGNVESERGARLTSKKGITFIDTDFDSLVNSDFDEKKSFENLSWIGVMDTYFVTAAKTVGQTQKGYFDSAASTFQGDAVKIPLPVVKGDQVTLNAGETFQKKYQFYVGPKKTEEMEKFDINLTTCLDMTLGFIAYPLLSVLRWLHGMVQNWGIAIILLTILVRLAMFPLAYKGMMSMGKMSQLNPKMKELREKYKNDKERLNREIMELYRKHKINPVGGCLPLMMQIPIFIALYSALLPAIELRHSYFGLWITDLSAADYTLILPLLMGISMFLQQKIAPTSASMDATQEKMMKWMPVIMVFFFLDFPAGLTIYWVVSNIISVLQQLVFNKARAKQGI